MSRPRRTAASGSGSTSATAAATPSRPGTSGDQDPDVDPEFAALNARQRNRIDRAFQRGIAIYENRSNKRRKLNKPARVKEQDIVTNASAGVGDFTRDDDDGRGFMLEGEDAAGGFMLDDDGDAGGGFIVDEDEGAGGFVVDEEGQGGGEGGFMPDEDAGTEHSLKNHGENDPPRSTSPSVNKRIPLHLLPSLLTSLGLPSDEDVLAVFRASASGWEDDDEGRNQPPIRKKRGGEEGDADAGGVELKDFRAVCAALMEDDDIDSNGDKDLDGNGDGIEGEEDDQEHTFELPSEEEESELSSLSGSEYGQEAQDRSTRFRAKGKSRASTVKSKDFAETDSSTPAPSRSRARRGRGKRDLEIDQSGKVRLNSRQKELAKDIWEMLKPPQPSGGQQAKRSERAGILGRDEVKKWVRELGEMWTEEEITDMVALFSTQHEQRGLSFDDFGGIMLRAGLV
ncbi:uncharacterized protein I303_102133 [Kwoniella dejecticola CBS 10117]|uniref:EF-hand domain-containing protein n=1 Tax=Kwoniella dejecticola CBS 10117 TaxID=1296121 RepID=A0A1A6ABT3_9TREE|nr:uncharacterized protein I303_01726 [Kwoniella dejecticola CBS 10117]OBR87519.1 hypothetical protein I303_01726 [Kwoniella dejecticola CBS 10117]